MPEVSPASLHRLQCLTEKCGGESRIGWISEERESLPACMACMMIDVLFARCGVLLPLFIV